MGQQAEATASAAASHATAPAHPEAERYSAGRPAALTDLIEDIRFDAFRSALYHQSRRAFCDSIHRWQMMAVLIGGSGAVASIAAASSVWTVVLSIVAAVAAASDAAFGWVVLARDHADLARRFYDVLAAVENGCDSEADCRRLRGSLVTLYGDELPPMRAVDAVAYNAAQRSLYGDDGKRLRVRWWESAFRHLWPFSGADFPMVAD